MTPEMCFKAQPTILSVALQQRYDQLPSPQCTNITYMNTFVHKMLSFITDADIRNIICHLSDAVSNLNRLQVSMHNNNYSNYVQLVCIHVVPG